MIKSMLPNTGSEFLKLDSSQAPTSFLLSGKERGLKELHNSLKSDDQANYVVPNMLSPAFRLENCLHVTKPGKANAALGTPEAKNWLKVLCAVLFGNQKDIQVKHMSEEDGANDSMLLRVLKETLEQGSDEKKEFTIFLYRKKDNDYAPIAFSYPGIKTGLCPAVTMNPDDFDDPDGWLQTQDVVDLLKSTGYESYRKAMGIFLQYENGHHKEGILASDIRFVCEALCDILKGTSNETPPELCHTERLPGGRGIADLDYNKWFTNKLIVLNKCEKSGQGVREIDGSNEKEKEKEKFILPLKKECMDEKDALEEICKTVEGKKVNDECIQITFLYKGTKYRKTYTKDEIIGRDDQHVDRYVLSSVAVWPDKKCSDWDRYFLYISSSVPSNPDLNECYKAEARVGTDWIGLESGERQKVDGGGGPIEKIDYVTKLDAYPQAISLNKGNEEVGMLLPLQEEQPSADQGQAQIGIDFGTSNTIAYLWDGQSTTPLKIDDSCRILVDKDDDSDLAFDFAPNRDEGSCLPFKTVVRKLPVCDRNHVGAFEALVAPLQYRRDLRDDLRKQLDDDLKWPDTRANVQGKTQGYLEYMMLMWLWQVRKSNKFTNLSYIFTYPKSQQVQLYQQTIEAVMSSMPSTFMAPNYNFKTESEVIYAYVNAKGTMEKLSSMHTTINPQTGYLLMDIGGGSVDISLWQNTQNIASLCSEVSLKDFAGNHMQVDQVYSQRFHRPELMAEIMNIDSETLEHELRQPTPKRSANIEKEVSLYEAVKESGQDAVNSFRRLWTTEIGLLQKDLKGGKGQQNLQKRKAYVNQIECYFHYLFFFSGYLTGKALVDNIMQRREGDFAVLMAGNGSHMYRLVDRNRSEFDTINTLMFFEGMKFSGLTNCDKYSLRIVLSPDQKHEVAFGAACYSLSAAAAPAAPDPMTHDCAKDSVARFARKDDTIAWLRDKDMTVKNERDQLLTEAKSYVEAFLYVLQQKTDLIQTLFDNDADNLREGVYTQLETRCDNSHVKNLPEAIVEAFKTMEDYVAPMKNNREENDA